VVTARKLEGTRSLTTLYVIGAACVLLLAGLITATAIREEYVHRIDTAQQATSTLARAFDEHIYRTFRALDQQSRYVADYFVRYPDIAELTARLQELLHVDDVAVQYAIIDARGRLYATSTGTSSIGIDLSDREHYRYYLQPDADSTYISKALLGRASHKWSIQYTRRIVDDSGAFRGVAVVSFDPLYLSRFYKSLTSGDDIVVSLFGEDGQLRATSQVDRFAAMVERNYRHSPLFTHYAAAAAGDYENIDATTGEAAFVSYRRIKDFPLIVEVSLPRATAFDGLRSSIMTYSGLFLALLLMIVLAGWLLRRYAHERLLAERRDREAWAAAREQQFMRSIIDTAGAIVFVADGEGRLVMANALFEQTFGPEVDGTWLNAVTRRPFDAVCQQLPMHSETQVADTRGRLRSIAWTLTGVHDSAGTLRHLVGIGLDLTEQHEAELAIYQSGKLVTLGEMATGLAHELNQPLNAMRLTLDNVAARHAAGALDEEYLLRKLDKLERNVTRASRIIDHMRIYGRRSDKHIAPIEPAEALRGALTIIGSQLSEAGIELRIDTALETMHLLGDLLLLEQVLINLLLNARDAINARRRREGADVAALITVAPLRDGAAGVCVCDSGGGVPADIGDRIFEPFFTTKPVGQGTGLGLALSYGIIRDLDGVLAYYNSGQGACFTIQLPPAVAPVVRELSDPQ